MDVLLVSGGKAAHTQAVLSMYMKMDKQKTSFLKVDSAGDVLMEAVSISNSVISTSRALD